MRPWRYLIIAAVLAVVITFGVIRSKTTHFECANCGEHFQVNIFKYLFTTHGGGKRYVKCPKCEKGDYLPPLKGKK